MPKHFFFDLDNTLALSRARMHPSHIPLLSQLAERAGVTVVTGGTIEHIREQLTPALDEAYDALAQSGNHAVEKTGATIWYEPFTERMTSASLKLIDELKNYFALRVRDERDLVDHRGAQIGYSVIGYHEDPEKKYGFDPNFSKRKGALEHFAAEVSHLREHGVHVVPAGSSGFNFVHSTKDKGHNVQKYLTHFGIPNEEALYVGDALNPGENDWSVVGVIHTKAVSGPDETFEFVRKVLS